MSKRVALALAIFVIIVGGALLMIYWKDSSVNYKNEQLLSEVETKKLYIDSDNDGLMDWEEGLWKTDPSNPDSNNDNLKDGESIRAGINPIGTGLNDKLATGTIETKINQTIESDLSETDKFSRELFAKYIGDVQNKGLANQEDFNQFLIDTVNNQSLDLKVYTSQDIKEITETSKALRDYGNALGKSIADANKKYPGNELMILDDAVDADNQKILEQLDAPISRYKTIRDAMLSMNVPGGISEIHFKMANLLNIMISGIENMRLIFSDPVRGLSSLSLYPYATGYLVTVSVELHNYFISKGVNFGKNEPGYLLTS